MALEIIFDDPKNRVVITRANTPHHGLHMMKVMETHLVLTYFPDSREFVAIKNRYDLDFSKLLYEVCKIPVVCHSSGAWLEDSPAGMLAAMKYGL